MAVVDLLPRTFWADEVHLRRGVCCRQGVMGPDKGIMNEPVCLSGEMSEASQSACDLFERVCVCVCACEIGAYEFYCLPM